jgi:ABC-2 type transport system permease protein
MSTLVTSPPSSDPSDGARRRPSGTSFVGLVGVELRRLWWRRLTKLVLLGVVAFIGVSAYAAFQDTSPGALAQRTADYTARVEEMKRQEAGISPEDRAAQRETCLKEEASAKASDPGVDFSCDQQFTAPTPAEFGIVAADRGGITSQMVRNGVPVLGFLALLLGASFVAAEFAAGSMGNWLTFQPRRVRVATAKLVAATGGGLVVGALGVGLAASAAALVTLVNAPPPGMPVGPPADIPGGSLGLLLVRVVVVAALAGLGGAVLALLVRSTAGVIGVALGWLLVVESFVGAAIAQGALQPWLLRTNVEGFVGAGTTYYRTTCDSNGCQMTGVPHGYTASWVFLLVVAVVGVAVALASFRRRDVT